jgi:hypothetical protein
MKDGYKLRGEYKLVHKRAGQVIGEQVGHNDITNEGLDQILDIMFNAASQLASWYIGIISNGSYSAVANTDVMNSHAGWIEFVNYDEATRVEWAPDAPSAQSITNSAACTFTFSASGTIQGIFVTSNSTKSGTTGKLWSTALFALPVVVADNDTIDITYTVVAARG